MILDVIKWIVNQSDGKVIDIPGRTVPYYEHRGTLTPISEPCTPSLGTINSLTGIVGYLGQNPDNLDLNKVFVVVERHNSVKVVSIPYGESQRDLILDSEYESPQTTGLEAPLDEFQALLMSKYLPGEDVDYLLQLLANVCTGENAEIKDNGIRQMVSVKTGITTVEMRELKPIVELAPYRVFPEIDQPTSPFVFRMRQVKDGGLVSCRLVNTGDETWKVKARRGIITYLKNALGDRVAIIG